MRTSANWSRRRFIGGVSALGLAVGTGRAAERLKSAEFPEWREGLLDIHHIATGRGESTLMVFPDGTTMLVDAGDVTGDRAEETIIPVTPDASRRPAEWIAGYIERTLRPLNLESPAVDLALMSHFHSDHIGCGKNSVRKAHGYALSGITELAEHIEIKKLVDRGFPDYDFPSRKMVAGKNASFIGDYLAFTAHQRERRKAAVQGFAVGSATQFALVRAPDRFPDFKIMNIAANACVGGQVVVPRERNPDENTCSCAVKITYGAFSYYTGGDLSGYATARDMETPVAAAVGRVDAMKLNHHGFQDSVNPAFLATLRPRVMALLAWDEWHPHPAAFKRLTDKAIYPGDRLIYATGRPPAATRRFADQAAVFRPCGHVVIRVAAGGSSYRPFVLDPKTFSVMDSTDELPSRANG